MCLYVRKQLLVAESYLRLCLSPKQKFPAFYENRKKSLCTSCIQINLVNKFIICFFYNQVSYCHPMNTSVPSIFSSFYVCRQNVYAFIIFSLPWELYRHLFEHISETLTLLTLQKGSFFTKALTVLHAALLIYYVIIAVCTARFNLHKCTFSTQNVFVWSFAWFPPSKLIISLNGINRFVLHWRQSVLCKVETEF